MTIDRGILFLTINFSFYKKQWRNKSMDDDILRVEVKALKAFHDINYKQIADELGVKQRSFYNWLAGQFDFSANRKRRLNNIIKQKKGK